MNYFTGIQTLAELKKTYRELAFKNHPDLGGSTTVMQEINNQFERLYNILKDSVIRATDTGYEHDYEGATASEYANYVYNEYRWRGRNYNGQNFSEIVDIIRSWLKNTYPGCKFSVRKNNYNSIYVNLIKADFEPFKAGSGLVKHSVNHYHIDSDNHLNARGKEVMKNITDFVMSYNYDNSDIMTDYFDTNFYFNLSIGKSDKPFEYVPLQIGKRQKSEKSKDSAEVKAIKAAMGKSVFRTVQVRGGWLDDKLVLGDIYYSDKGEPRFWAKHYPGLKTAVKRMNKLRDAGIECELRRCYIVFKDFAAHINEDTISQLSFMFE